MDAAHVVGEFISAVEAKDLDRTHALLADEVSYENVPMQPIVGRDTVRAVLASFLEPALEVSWPIRRQLVDDRCVINERIDRFRFEGGWLELPVCGVFEVGDDGRITLWRDYFDLATYTSQLAEVRPAAST
jgi:limonene-1,2-epoxide hydrolase